MSASNANPKVHLQLLRSRNLELERRLSNLKDISVNLDANINKIQLMFDSMLTSQENQCFDMVQFDEEIKSLTKTIFPPSSSKAITPRKREENSNLIMSQILGLQRLEPKQCEEQLQESDPLLKRVRQETRLMQRFMSKYSSFL
ncbi:hypothetical protein TRFO_25556 [Tritrichomonas foetus]|uniref:Uncharacterized protein n=1 Tax=Tritrichomonas foetus TaxID=1144522 RepID=A0A1J4K620_9EUKA|nr:hypothetical protein TRFO_25556 [Tritrichomonas foetus]|eukprot:OHT06442.1 hypothetical protein TRFO_25556 [Tritrichomonas foetus]